MTPAVCCYGFEVSITIGVAGCDADAQWIQDGDCACTNHCPPRLVDVDIEQPIHPGVLEFYAFLISILLEYSRVPD